jgi:hypothetical protein
MPPRLIPGSYKFPFVSTVFSFLLIVSFGGCSEEGQQTNGENEEAQSEEQSSPSPIWDPVPFHETWIGGRSVWFRPANGEIADVNPPRFSWPMSPSIPSDPSTPPKASFQIQLSRTQNFDGPIVDERVVTNFWSPSLDRLAPGRYFWRVGFTGSDGEVDTWSAARWFEVSAETPEWNREPFASAVSILEQRAHPRLRPPGGKDWNQWRVDLESSEMSAIYLARLRKRVEKARKMAWWRKMPPTDNGMRERSTAEFINTLGWSIFLDKLEGNEVDQDAKNALMQVASYPQGGATSPEYHGAKEKWPTSIVTTLALAYDLLHDQLTPEERQRLLSSIEWRLKAIYEGKNSWRSGGTLLGIGVSGAPESHPFQNFYWAMPAVLLTAGDLDIATSLTPVTLNYLANYTNAHGPDEGWNEAGRYIYEKSLTAMEAAAWVQALLPEIHIANNPFWKNFAAFLYEFQPDGVTRIGFGDYSNTLTDAYTPTTYPDALVLAGSLAGNQPCWDKARQLWKESPTDRGPADPLAALLATGYFPQLDEDSPAGHPIFWKRAGWFFGRAGGIDTADAIRVNSPARPLGGFSHSYAADGSFVWQALGETLIAGGGSTKFPDPFSRATLSHSLPLINGVGMRLSDRYPEFFVAARPLATVETDDLTGWFVDLTNAYREPTGTQHLGHYAWMPKIKQEFGGVMDLDRYVRGIFLVKDRWLVVHDRMIFDDAKADRIVSWGLQPQSNTDLKVSQALPVNLSFRSREVLASVDIATDGSLNEIKLQPGESAMINPYSGFDYQALANEALGQYRRSVEESDLHATSVWLQLDASAKELSVTGVFDARRGDGETTPSVEISPQQVRFPVSGSASPWTVAFDDDPAAAISLDTEAIIRYARESDPERLRMLDRKEQVKLNEQSKAVRWFFEEDFKDPGDLARWIVETQNAAVSLADGKLMVRNAGGQAPDGGTTIWLRPELPPNFIARIRCSTVAPVEKNANNLNFFTNAREVSGPLRFGRSGEYPNYHAIPNYTFTFVGKFPDNNIAGWSRIRRNPGFVQLAENADIFPAPLHQYEVILVVQDGRLQMIVDGVLVSEATDPDPLPGGHFGLRTWKTNVDYHSVEIGEILP